MSKPRTSSGAPAEPVDVASVWIEDTNPLVSAPTLLVMYCDSESVRSNSTWTTTTVPPIPTTAIGTFTTMRRTMPATSAWATPCTIPPKTRMHMIVADTVAVARYGPVPVDPSMNHAAVTFG